MPIIVWHSKRWKFVVGDDGKSLYLDYIPFGTTVIMK